MIRRTQNRSADWQKEGTACAQIVHSWRCQEPWRLAADVDIDKHRRVNELSVFTGCCGNFMLALLPD